MRPDGNYAAAVMQIKKQQQQDDSAALPGARSVFLTHGARTARSVVLLHGFGNSPAEFRGLADSLYSAGYNVWIPRLPYHADRSGASALSHLTTEDLREAARSAADIGAGLGDSATVVGFSTGAVADAWIAEHSPDVQRVVIVSPALALAGEPGWLAQPLVGLALRLPNINYGLARDRRHPDRELGWSTHAIAQIFKLGISVARNADSVPPSVRDIRMLLNANDHTISTGAAIALAKLWTAHGAKVRTYTLPASLRLPHDLIDATEPGSRPALVDAVLEALVGDTALPLGLSKLPQGGELSTRRTW